MNLPIILVTTRSFSSGKLDLNQELKNAGYQVIIGDFNHDLNSITPVLAKAVAWIAGVAPIEEQHLAFAANLKIIARYGVGFEVVDLVAARKKKIVVTNTPSANSLAVAEHSLALLFASARHVAASYQNVRKNNWKVVRGLQILGSKIGVVGFGQIGKLVVKKLLALEAEVLVSDPYVKAEVIIKGGAIPAALSEIAQICNFVLLQAPGGQLLVDQTWINRALRGQVIINTARADLVNEKAISEGLIGGQLGFYAADALVDEINSPLLAEELSEKVLVTAHLAGQTTSAIDQMGSMAVANVLAVLAGKDPVNPV